MSDDITLRNYPGYAGMFTRNQVLGAWRNGTRIAKVFCEPGDAHPLGALGTVLGSVAHRETGELCYFIEWDDCPGMAVGIVAKKIGAAS